MMPEDFQGFLKSYFGDIKNWRPLSGGDINDVYAFTAFEKSYCIKINDARKFPGMFEAEAKGLALLRNKSNFVVPEVVRYGEEGRTAFLIMEFIESGTKAENYAELFAQKLSELHTPDQAVQHFGLSYDNYIGSLPQLNTSSKSWAEFYGHCRLTQMAKICFDQGHLNQNHMLHLARLCDELDDIFPREQPSLLHGDLWGGNAMAARNGQPSIYDPAVYYGHREMDLGMMCLFGGFEDEIFEIYHDLFPLETNWRFRIELTQLYPLLVHLALFGRSYLAGVEKTILKF